MWGNWIGRGAETSLYGRLSGVKTIERGSLWYKVGPEGGHRVNGSSKKRVSTGRNMLHTRQIECQPDGRHYKYELFLLRVYSMDTITG